MTLDQGGVMQTLDMTGPIDYLMLEFPGTKISGQLVPSLLELVDRRLIRIVDALIVLKEADGSFKGLTTQELDSQPGMELGELEGASSGVLGPEDAEAAAAILEPDTSALLLVYENVWAVPFALAARRAGGQVVSSGRIPVQALLARLDALEAS